MKGIILAGGLGTRLYPLTKITNKHLLPVYDMPMIYYPITTLVKAGIKDIMVVTGGNNAGDFLRLLGNGKEFGLKRLHYAYQEGEGGIAQALSLAEEFAEGKSITVILGDNIFSGTVKKAVDGFSKVNSGAKIFLKEVAEPQRFGVPEISGGKIIKIEEKPKKPRSKYAVVGLYMYDNSVFDIIKGLKPSGRNELEITDVNNHYIQRGMMEYEVLAGWWTDAGTIESLYKANELVKKMRKKA
ncbi:MAG: NTP transferase domain-containing protein [Candidatus Aureabacteria bacterium]|nr:NTP transferase domain-containing protein [Candidatus Auribacterota bacterium]